MKRGPHVTEAFSPCILELLIIFTCLHKASASSIMVAGVSSCLFRSSQQMRSEREPLGVNPLSIRCIDTPMSVRRMLSQIGLAAIKALTRSGRPWAEIIAGILNSNNAVTE